jgi:DNA-binding response OmpR family regulator
VLRRGPLKESEQQRGRIEAGQLVIDSDRHEATLDGRLLSLTLAEFRLLRFLAANPGRVFTREQLVEKITAGESIVTDRNVDVHVSSLRKKLGPNEDTIVTVRGVGYKFKD